MGLTASGSIFQVVYDDVLIQMHGLRVVALEVPTGKKLWEAQLKNGVLYCQHESRRKTFMLAKPLSLKEAGAAGDPMA